MEDQHTAMLNYLNSFPPGYRFCPTDEELVLHYLRNKILNRPLPSSKILDINLYNHEPQDLSDIYRAYMEIEEEEKIMYFFTPRERKYPRGTRPNRTAGIGYWKATGGEHKIGPNTNPIGYKQTLVYQQGVHKDSTRTDWIMHEYRIDQKCPPRSTSSAAPNDMKLDDWVLCKMYLKENKSDTKNKEKGKAAVSESIICYGSSVSSVMQGVGYALPLQIRENNNVPINNFGATSSAAAPPPMEEAANYYGSSVSSPMQGVGYAPPFQIRDNNNVPINNFGATSSAAAAPPMEEATNYYGSSVSSVMQGVGYALPLQMRDINNVPVNFGATSPAAAAPPVVEATNDYGGIIDDPKLFSDSNISDFIGEDVNVILAMIEHNPPPTLDDVLKSRGC